MAQSTITLDAEVKAKLALLKGDRSWTQFLEDVVYEYPSEELLQEIERRLAEVREGRAKVIPWSQVKRKSRSLRT